MFLSRSIRLQPFVQRSLTHCTSTHSRIIRFTNYHQAQTALTRSMASISTGSSFSGAYTQRVVSAMRTLYPESHADHSFDNTGLLLESPKNSNTTDLVLLTNDLTTAVCDEAIELRASIVVSYHSIIFRPIKSITSSNTQQRSLLRLAAAGISVYCPHTAVDASPHGNAEWLIDIATGSFSPGSSDKASTFPTLPTPQGVHVSEYPAAYDPRSNSSIRLATEPHSRKCITPHGDASEAAKGVGYGRLASLDTPRPLTDILKLIQAYLQVPASGIALALPSRSTSGTGRIERDTGSRAVNVEDVQIKTIATCAGMGGGVFTKLDEKADLWITGELAHHEALYATENGISVICLHHSNSERGYLGAVMKPKLEEALHQQGEVRLSAADRDPFSVFTVV